MDYLIFAISWLGNLIYWGAIAFASLFLLRVILSFSGVNPFARIPYHLTHLTEPMVRPLRYQFSGRSSRYDLLPLVAGAIIFFTGLICADAIWQVGKILLDVNTALRRDTFSLKFALLMVVYIIGDLYILAILLRIVLPFLGVGYGNRLFRFIFRITEPLLKPLRKYLTVGMFDLSPMVALLLVRFAMGIFAGLFGGVLL
ncbi:MAG: YggT family protein [Acidobacteriota bacterium]